MSATLTPSVAKATTEANSFEEMFNTTAITCSISAAVAYFCIAGIICGMGLSGVRAHIHWNVCVSLVISNVLLLVGSAKEPESLECKAVSIATQIFSLAGLTWTTAEVIHLFRLSNLTPTCRTASHVERKSSKHEGDHVMSCGDDCNNGDSNTTAITEIESSHPREVDRPSSNNASVSSYYVIGWIVPCVYVAVTILPAIDSYGMSYNCWIITDVEVIWIFVAPTSALFLFHCVATSVTIYNSKNRVMAAALKQETGEILNETPVSRELPTSDQAVDQGTVFVHPPLYVVTEKKLTVSMTTDEAAERNVLQIIHWNFTVMPIITATWCLWISALTVRLAILLYVTCAVTAGQVLYAFVYYCVITFRLEREERTLKKTKTNEEARPVTILFGDEDNAKPFTRHRKIQNMELMMRTPTPFPNGTSQCVMSFNQGDRGLQEDEANFFAPSPIVTHKQWEDDLPEHEMMTGEHSYPQYGAREQGRDWKRNNRVKLEAFVNVGARVVVVEGSRSPSSGGYSFEFNRPVSRSSDMKEAEARLPDEDRHARNDLGRRMLRSSVLEYSNSGDQPATAERTFVAG